MRGLRTDCPFPVLPVALQSWEGGGVIQTFFADVVPAMDGLQWKTVSKGQWLVPFPQEPDHQMACDVANLVTACDKGWKFLSKNVALSKRSSKRFAWKDIRSHFRRRFETFVTRVLTMTMLLPTLNAACMFAHIRHNLEDFLAYPIQFG